MNKKTFTLAVIFLICALGWLGANVYWRVTRSNCVNVFDLVVGVLFGYFTTFSNYLFSFLPTPESLPVRLVMMLCSTCIIAVGIFFYLPSDIMPLAGEGIMKAISDKTGIAFDVTMVVVSFIACMVALGELGAVGIGTITAAVLVGTVLGFLTKLFGEKRDALLHGTR